MGITVYYNGKFMDYEEVKISPEDRGYLFADGVYEVVTSYQGKPFKLEEHINRLEKSAAALEISLPEKEELLEVGRKLLQDNAYENGKLYLQVTRGTEPRSHAYSDDLKPNILMIVKELINNPEEYFENGVKVITVPDERWAKCYIKSIGLLPNIMAKKQAKRAGAFEAVFVRDSFAMEGSSSNLFIVKDGEIITSPASNYILNGITRMVVIELALDLGFSIKEESISLFDFHNADEVFLTGTTTEVMPVVKIDDRVIKDGKPGEVSVEMLATYRGLL